MNWMRCIEPSIDWAIALASEVLPTPGTSSISRWPSASRQTSAHPHDVGLAADERLDVPREVVESLGEPVDPPGDSLAITV